MFDLTKIIGFDWDDGNARKNEKHQVSAAESEQVFFNAPLLLLADTKHSDRESRFHALGKTDQVQIMTSPLAGYCIFFPVPNTGKTCW